MSSKMRTSSLFTKHACRYLVSSLDLFFLMYSPFPHPNIINIVERLRSEIDGFSELVDWKYSTNEISRTEASSNSFHLLCLPSFTNLMPTFS